MNMPDGAHLELLSLAETTHVALVGCRVIVFASDLLDIVVRQLVSPLGRDIGIL